MSALYTYKYLNLNQQRRQTPAMFIRINSLIKLTMPSDMLDSDILMTVHNSVIVNITFLC